MAETSQSLKPALAFRPLTRFFDAVNNLLGYGPSLMRRVVAIADVKSYERVLDVGSGTGTLLFELNRSHPGVHIVGVEPDPQAGRIAREKLARGGYDTEVVPVVGQSLAFPEASFDVVTSTLMFHHLSTEAKREAVREIHRVLRQGGRFILVDFGKPQGVLAAVLLALGSLFDGRENLRANLEGRLASLLQAEGFAVAEVSQPHRNVHFIVAQRSPA